MNKSEKHTAWVRTLPCCICLNEIETQCAHVRYADPRAAKPITGMGTKPPDAFTLPLCNRHHAEQHSMGEREFWKRYGRDPVFICLALWRVSGDREAGCQIIAAQMETV